MAAADAQLLASGMDRLRVIECRAVFDMLTRNSGAPEITSTHLKKFFSGFPSGAKTNPLKEGAPDEFAAILGKIGAPPAPEGMER